MRLVTSKIKTTSPEVRLEIKCQYSMAYRNISAAALINDHMLRKKKIFKIIFWKKNITFR